MIGAAVKFLTGLSAQTWLVIGLIAMAGLWTWRVYDAGYDKADAIWRAKALEAKVAKLELELKVQRDADAAEDKLLADLEAETEQQKKVIDAYAEELKSRPDKCLLGDDAGRLQ